MKNEKFFVIFLFAIIVLISPQLAYAESSYVLPYPSYMPGNFLYKPRLIINKINSYIYFGDFGKFEYNLKEADHYLVEAKTLFEYKQYLLGIKALEKSDIYFTQVNPAVENAKRNNKNTTERGKILKEASGKHIEVLIELKSKLPEEFDWTPEKSKPTKINFSKLIDESIKIRSMVL